MVGQCQGSSSACACRHGRILARRITSSDPARSFTCSGAVTSCSPCRATKHRGASRSFRARYRPWCCHQLFARQRNHVLRVALEMLPEPRQAQNGVHRGPPRRGLGQHAVDKAAQVLAVLAREWRDGAPQDFDDEGRQAVAVESALEGGELEQDAAERPHVALCIVGLILADLCMQVSQDVPVDSSGEHLVRHSSASSMRRRCT